MLTLIFRLMLSLWTWNSVEQITLTHRYPDWLGVDGYEKLLFDSINGDQSHFVHSEEVIESWRIVDDHFLHW